MSESGGENLDDLMLGGVSEGVSESDEQFAERLKAAQAKLAQIAKDESKAKDFDSQLAKIITSLDPTSLRLVVFFLDHDIPSLTILASISIASDEAGKICYGEFQKYIDEKADFSSVGLDSKLEEKLSLWWTFILGADHISATTKFSQFKGDEAFVKFVSESFATLLAQFLQKNNVETFNKDSLDQVLGKYKDMMWQGMEGRAPESV